MDFEPQIKTRAPENRAWLRGPHGTEPGTTPSITLDLTLFDAATHYPDGYIKSGCVLGKVTATDLYGPYDPAATDGREDVKGLQFNSETIRPGQTKAGNALFVHGFADPERLPYDPADPGGLDPAAKAALSLIYWD